MSVNTPDEIQAPIIEELNSFYKLYFSHPWWCGREKRMRFVFLPSAWLIEKSEAINVRVGPQEFEARFETEENGELKLERNWPTSRLIGASTRGYDCYYFLNAVRPGQYRQEYFTNDDIERVLFLPLDIDVDKIESFGGLEEIEERAAWVIETGGSRGNRHVVVAMDQGDGERKKRIRVMGALCARWCEHFGSDSIVDAKRILRIPGTINWKRGKDAGSNASSRARLARGDLNYEVFGEREIEGLLSGHARCVRRAVERKERVEGENDGDVEKEGEFGGWFDALASAREGKWSVPRGVAWHGVLLGWGAQMVHEEVDERVIEANLRLLAEGAFEGSYTDTKKGQLDLEKMIRSTVGKYAVEVRAEVSAFDKEFLGAVVVEGERRIEEIGAAETPVIVAVDKREKLVTLNEDLSSFAHTLAAQWPDEDRGAYLKWLMRVGLLVNQALLKDRGVFEPACSALADRLKEYYMLHMGEMVVPRWRDDEILRPYWLDEDEQRAFLVEYVSSVALKIYTLRKEIALLPEATGVGGKKRRMFFQCKASVLSALVSGVAGKILLGGIDDRRDHGIIVFQNGTFYLNLDQFQPDITSGRTQWWAQARWTHSNPIAQRFDVSRVGVELNGGALLGMPMLQAYLEDTFVGEKNRMTREELIPRIIGYCMIRGNPAQKFFTFIGPGGSGKGVLCEIIEALVGDWNSARVNYTCLAAPWGFAPLEGKLVCVADEGESATRKIHDEVMSRVKAYTGSENFALRGMREVERTVEATAKILITCNKDLAANDSGGALARRMVCLSFDNVKGVESQKANLGKRIVAAEGDRIASWAVARLSAARKTCEFSALFELEGAEALMSGKDRMSEMIDPMANFVRHSITRAEGVNTRVSLILEVLRVLIEMERTRHPGGQLGVALKGAMERARFSSKRAGKGSFYLNCKMDAQKLLGAYEIDQESFARAIRSGPLGLTGSVELGLEDTGSGQSEMDWGK